MRRMFFTGIGRTIVLSEERKASVAYISSKYLPLENINHILSIVPSEPSLPPQKKNYAEACRHQPRGSLVPLGRAERFHRLGKSCVPLLLQSLHLHAAAELRVNQELDFFKKKMQTSLSGKPVRHRANSDGDEEEKQGLTEISCSCPVVSARNSVAGTGTGRKKPGTREGLRSSTQDQAGKQASKRRLLKSR